MKARMYGAATVEFALCFIVFITMVLAVTEFARLMFIFASAVDATRAGARLASVCAVEDANWVRSRMSARLSILKPANIDITYPAPGCSARSCPPVTVKLTGVTVALAIPWVPLSVPLPAFSTSIPAESLDSSDNSLCQ